MQKYSKFATVLDPNYKFFFEDKIIMLCEMMFKYKKYDINILRSEHKSNNARNKYTVCNTEDFFDWYDNLIKIKEGKEILQKFSFDLYNASLMEVFADCCQKIYGFDQIL